MVDSLAVVLYSLFGLITIGFLVAVILQYLTIRQYQRFILAERNPAAFHQATLSKKVVKEHAAAMEKENKKRTLNREFDAMIISGVAPKNALNKFELQEEVIQ